MRIKGLSEGAGGAEAAYTIIDTLERARMALASFIVSCIPVQEEVLRNIRCVNCLSFLENTSATTSFLLPIDQQDFPMSGQANLQSRGLAREWWLPFFISRSK